MKTEMKWENIYREITPLTQNDCFVIFPREKNSFNFPLHTHQEIELNFIQYGSGIQRIVGDNIEEIDDIELVLIGSNLPHGWFNHNCSSDRVLEITLQFHHNLLEDHLLHRNQLSHIKNMLEHAGRGLKFSNEAAIKLKPKLVKLTQMQGFGSVLELLSLLHDLSIASDTRLLSSPGFNKVHNCQRNNRIQEVFDFIRENLSREISIAEVAAISNMSKEGFSRFFRKHTGKTFVETLNATRLGYASRALIETDLSITQIANNYGFNNLSYFNRLFKRKHGCTPKAFKDKYAGKQIYV